MRRALVAALVVALSVVAHAQTRYGASVYVQTAAPTDTSLVVGSFWYDTQNSVLRLLTALPSTWTTIGWSTGGFTTGDIIFTASACRTGFTEVSALNGRMVRGTVAANMNVGQTGGADAVTPTFTGNAVTSSAVSAGTPAGTNSAPALTMNSYTPTGVNGTASFTPAGTNAAITAGTPAGTNGASATSGNCAATSIAAGTGATTACKATAPNLTVSAQTFTGSALATHTHTFTGSSGTVPAETFTGQAATLTGTVAAPTFTGSALATHAHATTATGTISAVDTRAAFLYLIACQKN